MKGAVGGRTGRVLPRAARVDRRARACRRSLFRSVRNENWKGGPDPAEVAALGPIARIGRRSWRYERREQVSLLDGTRGLDTRNGGLVPSRVRFLPHHGLRPASAVPDEHSERHRSVDVREQRRRLTAGRADGLDGTLFPYVTVDQLPTRITTGPITLFRVRRGDWAAIAGAVRARAERDPLDRAQPHQASARQPGDLRRSSITG